MHQVKLLTFCLFLTTTTSILVPTAWPALEAEEKPAAPTRPGKIRPRKQYRRPQPAVDYRNDWVPIPNPYRIRPASHKNKDYRDDRTHEPENYDSYRDVERPPNVQRTREEKGPKSVHEEALDIPTKPIYPGEGQWAKRGQKFRPFISPHIFPEFLNEEQEDEPEGYEVFVQNQDIFDKEKNKFEQSFMPFKVPQNEENESEESDNDEETSEENDDGEFTPTRLYTQVRRTADTKHLPRDEDEPRLREVIKDSKIQTVYTEEGYEDIAYDHGDHEKKAENDEGIVGYKHGKHRARLRDDDSDSAGSDHHPSFPKQTQMTMLKSEVTSIKDKGTEMEITSEVKLMMTPNNGTKAMKYVKISPKTYRYDGDQTKKRVKRFSDDHAEIEIDPDAIDDIDHSLPYSKIVQDTKEKYPYYGKMKEMGFNPNSPLQYAENMDNIPRKLGDDLAFYDQADRTHCEEVPTDVNPVPDRVETADKNEGKVEKLVNGPRLKNLGDKIDCFKVKYFGDDPLDSPIFKEDTVGPVPNIFNIKTAQSKKDPEVEAVTEKVKEEKIENKTIHPDVEIVNVKELEEKANENKIQIPVISIMTTPKYTIDLTPKHIYHQIELLQHLPEITAGGGNTVKPPITVQKYISTTELPVAREPKILTEPKLEIVIDENNSSDDLPESQALRRLKNRRRHRPTTPPPTFHIFDINRFLPQNPYLDTYLPKASNKHEVTGPMKYKQEIQPNEQFAVLVDVMNNIKDAARDPLLSAASQDVKPISVKLNNVNFEQYKNHKMAQTTSKPKRANKYRPPVEDTDNIAYDMIELLKIGKTDKTTTRRPTVKTTTEEIVEDNGDQDETQDVVEVVGLKPPIKRKIVTKTEKPEVESDGEPLNIFYVIGMKPPPKQKVYFYSDYNNLRRKSSQRRRYKRNAKRQNYAEVNRNNNKTAADENEDDYEPHRPRNYYYDEKTGRIVYNGTQTTEAPAEELIEITEKTLPKPSPRTTTLAPTTRDPNAPTLVDFLKILKSNPNYTAIPDPTTIPKSTDTLVQTDKPKTTTTPVPISTEQPAFLGIIALLRSDPKYQEIEDKKTKKSTTTTTTLAPELEPEVPEESRTEEVKNAPGGQIPDAIASLQIFDINDYLPKVRNYTLNSEVDTTKYQTIQRPTVTSRHSLSSRYNSEDDKLENVNTSKQPVLQTVTEEIREYEEPTTSTTTRSVQRRRGRFRARTTTTTTEEPMVEPVSQTVPKPQRQYPRRRRTRIKLELTTEAPENQEDGSEIKSVQRRHQPENEPRNQIQPRRLEQVQIINRFDENQKHGGNYRKDPDVEDYKENDEEDEDEIEKSTDNPVVETKSADVEIYKNYDKTKKHGGNYRKIDENEKTLNDTKTGENKQILQMHPENLTTAEVIQTRRIANFQIFQRPKNDEETTTSPTTTTTTTPKPRKEKKSEQLHSKSKNVEIFKEYDKNKKHGGNYRQLDQDGSADRRHDRKEVSRLTDIVPKPFTFYSDPKLPDHVNQLKEIGVIHVPDEDVVEDFDMDVDDEGSKKADLENETVKKIPKIIKDPSKRLYYYAPL